MRNQNMKISFSCMLVFSTTALQLVVICAPAFFPLLMIILTSTAYPFLKETCTSSAGRSTCLKMYFWVNFLVKYCRLIIRCKTWFRCSHCQQIKMQKHPWDVVIIYHFGFACLSTCTLYSAHIERNCGAPFANLIFQGFNLFRVHFHQVGKHTIPVKCLTPLYLGTYI